MSIGRRADMASGARRSSYCSRSTATVVVVALCLVAVWMASSVLVTPAESEFPIPPSHPKARRPVPAEGTSDDDPPPPPPVTQQVPPPVTKDTATGSSTDGVREQVRQPREQQSAFNEEQAPKDDGGRPELLNETTTERGPWPPTQAAQSNKDQTTAMSFTWKLCNVDAGADYIPCLDNVQAISKLRSTKHYEHRERHCPEKPPTCLVPLPEGYRNPIRWPKSRDQVCAAHSCALILIPCYPLTQSFLLLQIWYNNVPHTKLVEYKGHQNWVKVSGEHLIFPGGGTQFKHGALHYIDFIQEVTLYVFPCVSTVVAIVHYNNFFLLMPCKFLVC